MPDARPARTSNGLQPILVRHPNRKGLYSKANLIAGYRYLVAEGDIEQIRCSNSVSA